MCNVNYFISLRCVLIVIDKIITIAQTLHLEFMAVVMHFTGTVHITINASLPPVLPTTPGGHGVPPAPRGPRGGHDDDSDGPDGGFRRSNRRLRERDHHERHRMPSRSRGRSRSRLPRRERSASRRASPSHDERLHVPKTRADAVDPARPSVPPGSVPLTSFHEACVRVPATPHAVLSAAPITPFGPWELRGLSPLSRCLLKAPERPVRPTNSTFY